MQNQVVIQLMKLLVVVFITEVMMMTVTVQLKLVKD
jgi:hypothetical protein